MQDSEASLALVQMSAEYTARYPEKVRDAAETLCNTTTRLGFAERSVRQMMDQIRWQAAASNIDTLELQNAVEDYTRLESAAENLYLRQKASA